MNDIQCLIDRQLGIYSRFSYDNILKRLAVAEEESFYGLQAVRVLAAHLDHDPPIFACRFAETRGYDHVLALANEDGRVAIQDTSKIGSADSLEGFQCHNNAVFDLAWTPGGMSFVTVSGDHTACLWDISEGAPKSISLFSSHTKSVKTAVFRPTDPSVFATGARDGHILVWDIRATNQPALVLKPDNCLMGCHSGFAPKTPSSHGKRPRVDNQRAVSITGLVFQDDATLLSCGECDGNIKVWDLRKNYSAYTREPLPKHSIPYCGSSTKNGYTNLIVDDARIRLYASCMDDVIYCFNISTYNSLPEQRYVGHENRTFYIKSGLSPDCQYLVSGSSDKHAYIWNVKYSQPVVRLAGHWAEVTCAAWRRSGDATLVTCSDDARHKIWRVGSEFPGAGNPPGRAEVVPLSDLPTLPPWGDRTPKSLKRKSVTTPSISAKRAKAETTSVRKTKRCLTDLMNASRDCCDDTAAKRPQLGAIPENEESKLLRAGTKRPADDNEHLTNSDWRYMSPQASTSYTTPTKSNQRDSGRVLSPKSSNAMSLVAAKVSPSKVRVIRFSPPTRDLPDFVRNGDAPHLSLMSPAKKKPGHTDWLTLMTRERRCKTDVADKTLAAPLSPKENVVPTRRGSVSEKTPKSNKKTRTLLKYFSVASKEQ